MSHLPGHTTEEDPDLQDVLSNLVSYQHPDHERKLDPASSGEGMMGAALSGGCQCGAVRYRVDGALHNAHICHCRMCQKASGNYFLPLARADNSEFHVTRGEIAWFHSSDVVRRGFCARCGTPLAFDVIGGGGLNVTLGSLDQPTAVKPAFQSAEATGMPWFDALSTLPPDKNSSAWFDKIAPTNHQHPDHDTVTWPLEERT